METVYVRFVSFRLKATVSFHILITNELRLSLCFNTFRNLNNSLNKEPMSAAAETITTE